MTRLALLGIAILALPGGCTILANNALPDGSSGGATADGGGPATTGGGTGGTSSGAGGEGGTGGGPACVPTAASEDNCFDGTDNDCKNGTDCSDGACTGQGQCVDLPPNALYVLQGLPTCPTGFNPLVVDTCPGCSCTADDPGTCQYETSLYDNDTCTGAPLDSVTVAHPSCEPASATSATGNVWATTRFVPLVEPTCSSGGGPVPPAKMTLCQSNGVGACGDTMSCVPVHPAATVCELFDGNVSACPASRPLRQLVFVGGTGDCPCECGFESQDCDGIPHTHLFNMPGCAEPPSYTAINAGPSCTDSKFTTINSVNNHDGDYAASDATCGNVSPPSGGTTKTLCCESGR